MSGQPETGRHRSTRWSSQQLQLVLGTIIFLAVTAAWVFAKLHQIDTGELLAFAVPVVGALFLISPIGKAADAATQAATQTNGMMSDRIKAAVAAALADRDAARTRQHQGDISEAVGSPTDPTAPTPESVTQAPYLS